jgi:hypothetical protein
LYIESMSFLIFFLFTSFSKSSSNTIALNSVMTYQQADFTAICQQFWFWDSLTILDYEPFQKLLVLDLSKASSRMELKL